MTGFTCGFRNFGFSQENERVEVTKMVPLRGKVVDKNGRGISKVQISIFGTTLGRISGEDGSFEISVPEDQPFGLLCRHPGYIEETFPVNTGNKNNFTIVLTEAINTIDFINKAIIYTDNRIDKNTPIPVINPKVEEEGNIVNDYPDYPGGQNGFWQRYTKEYQILSVTNKGKHRLKGIYHGTLMISEKGFMMLLKVDEPINETQQKTLQDFFLGFGQWKPMNWRGKPMNLEYRFIIKFD